MATFYTNTGSFENLIISGATAGTTLLSISGSQGSVLNISDASNSTLFSVSTGSQTLLDITTDKAVIISGSLNTTGSVTFKGVTESNTATRVLLSDSNGQLYYTASSAIGVDTSQFVRNNQTSSFVTNNQTSSFVTNSQTSSFVTNSQTSSFVTNNQTSSFVTNSQTSSFVTNNQTSSFVTNSQTSSFVTNNQTSSFVTNSQTSSFVTNSQTSSFVTNSQTSSFVTNSQTSSFVTNSQTSSIALSRIVTGSVTASVNVGSTSFQLVSGSSTFLSVSSSGNVGIGITSPTSKLHIIGSGSATPILAVSGSQGDLFTVTDSLSGSLFAVNDVDGLSILEVFSDDTILMGNPIRPATYTTVETAINTGTGQIIYQLPTASYWGAFYDYSVKSGSVGRVGSITAMWSGSSVNFTETTASSFGTTTEFRLGVIVTGSNMALTGSTTSGDSWIVRTIIRAI